MTAPECPNCGADDTVQVHASVGTFHCLACDEFFDEGDDFADQVQRQGWGYDDDGEYDDDE